MHPVSTASFPGRLKPGSAEDSPCPRPVSPNPQALKSNSRSTAKSRSRIDTPRVMTAGYQKQLAQRFHLQFSGKVVLFYCVCCSCIAFGFVKRSQGQTCGLFLRPETAGTLKRGSDFEAPNSSI